MSTARQSSPRPTGFPLQLSCLAGSVGTRQRKDPFARLLLVHSGKGVLVYESSEEFLTASSVVLMPPGLAHTLNGDADLKWTLIRFDAAKIRMETWDIAKSAEFRRVFAITHNRARASAAVFGVLSRHFVQAVALAGEITREITERRPGWRDLAIAHFQHLVILLSRYAGAGFRISTDASQRVAAALRHIDSHFSEEIDPAALAGGCGMSERSFYRLFLQATGQTPLRYLKRVRIDRAAELLRSTDRPVTEIAYEVGFEDSNFFAREFRKLREYPPTAYRKIWQE